MTTPTILLVEDDDDQRDMYLLMLRVMGLPAQAVATSAAARAVLAREPVALLLTDWYLPEPDGPALIQAARDRDPAIRTVLMSNAWHVDTAATAASADGWYRKGEPLAGLQVLIQTLLSPADISAAGQPNAAIV